MIEIEGFFETVEGKDLQAHGVSGGASSPLIQLSLSTVRNELLLICMFFTAGPAYAEGDKRFKVGSCGGRGQCQACREIYRPSPSQTGSWKRISFIARQSKAVEILALAARVKRLGPGQTLAESF
jgi:hypothetical protein